METSDILLVITTFGDGSSAKDTAEKLVAERLAACVTVLPGATSTFRWKGEIDSAAEVVALIKTTSETYPELERRLKELHPYDTPEILAFPAAAGLAAYLDWVGEEVSNRS